MNNFQYRFLIYFFLVAFSGQVVALPLLSCCNEMNHDTESNSIDHGHSMSMDHHMDSYMNSKIDSETQLLTDSGNHDCNNQCGFCITTSVVMVDADYLPKTIQNYYLNSAYNLILPSSSSDNPFRPPITA